MVHKRFFIFISITATFLCLGVSMSFAQGIKSLDSDSDGLPDSLEKVFGTSLMNKDSDGDGYDDKAEVTSGYNPMGSGIWKPSKEMKSAFEKHKKEKTKQKKESAKNDKKKVSKITNCGNASDETKKESVERCMDKALKTCTPAFMEEGDLFGVNKQEIFLASGSKGGCVVRLSYKKTDSPDLKGKTMICPLDQTKTYRKAASDINTCSGSLKKVFDSFLSSGASSGDQQQAATQESVAFETFASGMYKGQKKADRLLIKFQDQWDALWKELYSDANTRPPLPSVDLTTHSIIALFGKRGDYSIRLTKLEVSSGSPTYTIDYEKQRKKCPSLRTLQQPFTLITIPKKYSSVSGSVTFSNTIEKEECQPTTIQEPDETFLYKNSKFNLSLLLPDAAKYFTITESEKKTQDDDVLTFLVFSQFSAEENKAVELFTLAVVPNELWPKVEKQHGISLSGGGGATAYKLGASATHTIAWYGVGGGSFGPSDVGRYESEDIVVISGDKK